MLQLGLAQAQRRLLARQGGIRLCGGIPVEVFAGSDQEYKVTVEQLEAARTEKSKAVLICSPGFAHAATAVRVPEPVSWVLLGLGLAGLVGLRKKFKK